jgi:hypothetical protein
LLGIPEGIGFALAAIVGFFVAGASDSILYDKWIFYSEVLAVSVSGAIIGVFLGLRIRADYYATKEVPLDLFQVDCQKFSPQKAPSDAVRRANEAIHRSQEGLTEDCPDRTAEHRES